SCESPVLRDISFGGAERDVLGLMGPSGSGKTTVLNLIAGIDKPTAGTIDVAGTEITTMGESPLAAWRARHIGFVFQFYNLLPVLPARDTVDPPSLPSKLPTKETTEHVEVALKVVSLADRLHHYA